MQGVKTVVAVNDTELVNKYAAEAQGSNELWLSYRDDHIPLRAKHPGDPRAALTPWLAHQVAIQCISVHMRSLVEAALKMLVHITQISICRH